MSIYSGKSFDISSQISFPIASFIKPDGMSFYIIQGTTIYEYTFTTAGDVNTLSYTRSHIYSSYLNAANTAMCISSDGLNLYFHDRNGSQARVVQVSLNTAWNLSDINSSTITNTSSGTSSVRGLWISNDGTNFFIPFQASGFFIKYTLSTPYDFSTSSEDSTVDLDSTSYGAVNPKGIYISSDGLKMGVDSGQNDEIVEMYFSSSFDISSITYSGNSSDFTSETTDSKSTAFFETNNKMYIVAGNELRIFEYNSAFLPDPITPPAGTISEKASGDNYVTLTWMNSLGGWEYWTFTSRHSYGDDVQDLGIIERDIFQDWDSGFINGQSEREVLGKDVTPFTVLRSQALTKEQVDVIKNIRSAIKVQVVTDSGFTTVIVDAGSFTYRTDREKNILIEFTIRYPRTQIQKL